MPHLRDASVSIRTCRSGISGIQPAGGTSVFIRVVDEVLWLLKRRGQYDVLVLQGGREPLYWGGQPLLLRCGPMSKSEADRRSLQLLMNLRSDSELWERLQLEPGFQGRLI
jgi:hypothetical protein